jgi:hypothetical protein
LEEYKVEEENKRKDRKDRSNKKKLINLERLNRANKKSRVVYNTKEHGLYSTDNTHYILIYLHLNLYCCML